MGWEQRGNNQYYYRKEREGSRVKSVYVGRGEIAHMISEIQSSSPVLERLARATRSPDATFAGLGQFPQAIDAYKRAIAVKPDDSESHYLVGGAYYGSRRFAEAVNSLSRATEIKPDYVPYGLALGKAYFSLGNREAALRQHTKLKTLDSEAANELVKIMDGKTQ